MRRGMWILLIFAAMVLFVFTGIFLKSRHVEPKSANEIAGENANKMEKLDDFEFFGVWCLTKIALESKGYDGNNWGGRIFYERNYLGYEIEYSSEFFRLGSEIFPDPEYRTFDFTVFDYNNNGDFQLPDLYDFIRTEGIELDGVDEYKNIGDIPLTYFVVSFKEEHFIPVGTQCLILNNDAMLIGVKGNVIFAQRVEKCKQPDYRIEEKEIKIEADNIHIDIKYPAISEYKSSLPQGDFYDVEKQQNINKLLTPPEIKTYHTMILKGLIELSDTGELVYNFPPNSYHLGIEYMYTMGLANNKFLNLYKRSISYTRNSNWDYGALLIDMELGKQIMLKDFFDADVFYKYIVEGAFKSNNEAFDFQSFFENVSDDQLIRYLRNTFINQDKQIEVVLIYGEGPETIIYADLESVKDMIKLQYQEYF